MTTPSQNKSLENKERNKRIFVWSLYDFANTSYFIVVVTFVYAVYFVDVVAKDNKFADFYWSLGTSISMLVTAVISPVLGAIADYSSGKMKFLIAFTMLCILSSALLFFVGPGAVVFGLVLFILANIGAESGLVFYDAFLPEIAEPKEYGKISGNGYAYGYLGSLASLIIVLPLALNDMVRTTFPVSALFFLIFAMPMFLLLKERKTKIEAKESYWAIGFSRVKNTIINLKHYKNLLIFLLAFFMFMEGVNTTIFFSGIFGRKTLQFEMQDLVLFFAIVQISAIAGAYFFGKISDKIGYKKTITITLIIWIFVISYAFFTSSVDSTLIKFYSGLLGTEPFITTQNNFYIVGFLAGTVLGATPAVSRSLMSLLIPNEKKTEFFGFYSFFSKSSAILGPLLFGLVSSFSGSQRIAILSVGIFFVIGLIILSKVTEPEKDN